MSCPKESNLAQEVRKQLGLLFDSSTNQVWQQVVNVLSKYDLTTLVLGETGTGKTKLAQAIHMLSSRKKFPFVTVDCTALPESLAESLLFGHEPNSFTGASSKVRCGFFEAADGGTIFLDEIGELPPHLQAKLLRFLEEKKFLRVGGTRDISVDTRVIAATHRDLGKMVSLGQFRQDLLFRLDEFSLTMPSLRDQTALIPQLVHFYLAADTIAQQAKVDGVESGVCQLLAQYPWPGNYRELRSVVRKMAVSAAGRTVSIADVPASISAYGLDPSEVQDSLINFLIQGPDSEIQLPMMTADEVLRLYLLRLLVVLKGNKTKVAATLGVTNSTLYAWLKRWDLSHLINSN